MACDLQYYMQWTIGCIKSIQQYVPWLNVHVVIVNPPDSYVKINNVKYYNDYVNFDNETCQVAYYQAVRFIKCAELFPNNELVMSIDCDTVLQKSFTQEEFVATCSTIHVQRHQKADRWMAGLVTYGSDNQFRNRLRSDLLSKSISDWTYGWDQRILNILSNEFDYKKLEIDNWMSFGKGAGNFLTLKGSQKINEKYLTNYNNIIKNFI